MVISRSIVTDLYTGSSLAKTFSLMAAINGIAPVGAPILGGIMMKWTDWHGIFLILLVIGVVLLGIGFVQHETLEKRIVFRVESFLHLPGLFRSCVTAVLRSILLYRLLLWVCCSVT